MADGTLIAQGQEWRDDYSTDEGPWLLLYRQDDGGYYERFSTREAAEDYAQYLEDWSPTYPAFVIYEGAVIRDYEAEWAAIQEKWSVRAREMQHPLVSVETDSLILKPGESVAFTATFQN